MDEILTLLHSVFPPSSSKKYSHSHYARIFYCCLTAKPSVLKVKILAVYECT